ncbi:MAG: CCA tRNA nucleotidyltransferase [Chloroflexi bacterium]|nr:CCA tRNA nucleotidyltransferase [Chloroflexota bacterium]
MENLANLLDHSLSATQKDLVQKIAREAAALGMRAYLVGGFVRDAILGRPVNDFDLVFEGNATKLASVLARTHGGRVTVHSAFHTATWFLDDDHFIDLISARAETYEHPAALPTVQLGSLADDLRRRDFTLNAMALCLDKDRYGELADPLDGREDLQRGLIRVLHPRSFVDDPTRLFRAVRYAARYGFALAPETEALVPSALDYVDKLSPERLRHELDLILDEDDPVPMVEKLWALGIVQAARPALPSGEATRTRVGWMSRLPSDVKERGETRWMIWLMSSLEEEIGALEERLRFTADLSKKIRAAAAVWRELDSFAATRPSECTRRLDKFPAEAIRAASICAPQGEAGAALEMYLTKWKNVKPFADGGALLKMGAPFGARVGQILWELRAAWLDGTIASEREEMELAAKLVGARKN